MSPTRIRGWHVGSVLWIDIIWYPHIDHNIEAMELAWSTRFKPYLDPARWPAYTGDEFRPDPALVITTRGRRQSKRFEMEMDKMKRKRNKFDALTYETHTKNCCTVCHKIGHKQQEVHLRDEEGRSRQGSC
jgi:hypothetical protein